MAYEAVPIDVKIQKLTAAERDALSRYKIHENINTFLGNETTPLIAAGAALAIATPILIDLLLKRIADLELPGVNLPTPEDIIQIKKEAQESFPAQVIEKIWSASGFLGFIGLTPKELQRKKAGTVIGEELFGL